MASPPVVLDARPPIADSRARVAVIRREGCVNAGDGARGSYLVRYVSGQRVVVGARPENPCRAATEAAALVREYRPLAVWLVGRERAGAFAESTWRPLARAAADARAAFVAWTG